MINTIKASLAASCILLAGGCASRSQPQSEYLVIGHRGSPGYGAENTIAGFRRACELGADGFELDLILTGDGELAVLHDWTLNRLIGEQQLRDKFPNRSADSGKGPEWFTRRFTLAELASLEVTQQGPQAAMARPVTNNTELTVCSYSEALEAFAQLREQRPSLKLYTEIKTSDRYLTERQIDQTADKVIEALAKHDELAHPESHWLQSFDARVMRRLAKAPELKAFDKSQLLSCEPGLSAGSNPVVLDLASINTEADLRKVLKAEALDHGMTMVHGWKLMWWHLLEVKGIDCAKVAHDLGLQIHAFTFRDERYRSDYQNRPVLAPNGSPFNSPEEEVAYFFERGFDAVMTDTITSAVRAKELTTPLRPVLAD